MSRRSDAGNRNASNRSAPQAKAAAVARELTTIVELPQRWALLLVALAVLFNAAMLWPELLSGIPPRNDSAFHLMMIRGASDALSHGQSLLDFWIPNLDLGFPQFLYYQNLPHIAVVFVHRLLLQSVPLETIFNVTRYLLLVLFPVTVFWSMRRLHFAVPAAACSAMVSTLISSDAHLGFEYNSYLWRGFGLYTQLWAMHVTFIATALLYATIRDGRNFAASIVALSVLALTHLVFAYMMAITALVMLLVLASRDNWKALAARLAMVGAASMVIASYMLVPFALSSSTYMNTSAQLAGSGHEPIVAAGWIFLGELMDVGRLPVITMLTATGVLVAAIRFRKTTADATRFVLVALVVWTVLYVGHPTVGPLAAFFPAHNGYVTARFVSSVEVFVIMIIGVGGGWAWQQFERINAQRSWQSGFGNIVAPLAFVLAALAILSPAIIERARYYGGNRRLIAETRDALRVDGDLKTILQTVRDQPGGRLYAGLPTNWGAQVMVGPTVRATDVIHFYGLPIVGPPYQQFSLASTIFEQFREGDEDSFNLLDVRWVITPIGAKVPDFYRPFQKTASYMLYRVPTSGIAQYVEVTPSTPVHSQLELYTKNQQWYVSEALDSLSIERWEYPASTSSTPIASPTIARCANGGRVTEVQSSPGMLNFRAECATLGAMLLKFTYHPNWRVFIDGVNTPTYMLAPSLLGFDIAAGTHEVEARYVPTPMKLPLFILGLFTLIATVAFRNRLDVWPSRFASISSP